MGAAFGDNIRSGESDGGKKEEEEEGWHLESDGGGYYLQLVAILVIGSS